MFDQIERGQVCGLVETSWNAPYTSFSERSHEKNIQFPLHRQPIHTSLMFFSSFFLPHPNFICFSLVQQMINLTLFSHFLSDTCKQIVSIIFHSDCSISVPWAYFIIFVLRRYEDRKYMKICYILEKDTPLRIEINVEIKKALLSNS